MKKIFFIIFVFNFSTTIFSQEKNSIQDYQFKDIQGNKYILERIFNSEKNMDQMLLRKIVKAEKDTYINTQKVLTTKHLPIFYRKDKKYKKEIIFVHINNQKLYIKYKFLGKKYKLHYVWKKGTFKELKI